MTLKDKFFSLVCNLFSYYLVLNVYIISIETLFGHGLLNAFQNCNTTAQKKHIKGSKLQLIQLQK